MFVFLKYADNKELMVNSNCAIRILLNYIRTVCLPDESSFTKYRGKIDLCDTKGQVVELSDCPPMNNAAEYLKERETYIPVLIKQTQTEYFPHILPLLIDVQTHFPAFNLIDNLATPTVISEESFSVSVKSSKRAIQ